MIYRIQSLCSSLIILLFIHMCAQRLAKCTADDENVQMCGRASICEIYQYSLNYYVAVGFQQNFVTETITGEKILQ